MALIGCVALGFANSSRADDAPTVSGLIAHAGHSYTSALVIVGPRSSFSFNRRQTESDLPKIGCVFKVADRDDMDALVTALAEGEIVEMPREKHDPDARIGIWLRSLDGSETKLIFGRLLRNGPPNGLYNGTTSVITNEGFEESIRIWALHLKISSATPPCDPNEGQVMR